MTVGPKGRIVVPAALRRELQIDPGSVLIARSEAGRLVLESRAAVLARLQARAAVIPASVSLVDELIADRRGEALRETA